MASAPAYGDMASAPAYAVCLTGLERSFAEIGGNVREALFTLLHGGRVTIFGVRPSHDSWGEIKSLLPIARVVEQRPCWTPEQQNMTLKWMHCDFRLRTGDCRLSFLQALCDMQSCEAMIDNHELARGGRRFDAVVRLRADLFWEASPAPIRTPLAPNTVYVPAMDTPGGEAKRKAMHGVNDHLAFGDRDVMRLYLTRLRHILHPKIFQTINLGGSEQFLGASLTWDRVSVVRMQPWMYCPHTPRNLLRGASMFGCVARVRCRMRCKSLFCPHVNGKSDQCECFDESCATFVAKNSTQNYTGFTKVPGRNAVIGPMATPPIKQFRNFMRWRNPGPKDWDWKNWCSDLVHTREGSSTQALSKLPSSAEHWPSALRSHGLQLFHSSAKPCPWPNVTSADGSTVRSTEDIDTRALPKCFFPSHSSDLVTVTRIQRCQSNLFASTYRRYFASQGGWFPFT